MDLVASFKPAYFNIDDQVSRSLADYNFSAKRQECSITVSNVFYAAVTHEAQKDSIEAFKAGDFKAILILIKQAFKNLGAICDMKGDMMLFININSNPGATRKPKSIINDILRNEFSPGVTDRGRSSSTRRNFKPYEEHCLSAIVGSTATAHADRHLFVGNYCASSGAETIP